MRKALAARAAAAVWLPFAAGSADTVKIGAVYPLSGNAASAGNSTKAAIELATEIINGDHPELGDLLLAKGVGLPNLGGAKVEVVFADQQGSPSVAQNQALRLITQEKVVALTGAYQSSATQTMSAIAERYGVPLVNGESAAADLSERGFKWFFRTTPIGPDFAAIYTAFLDELKAKGKITAKSIAIVNENTDYGTSVATSIRKAAESSGYKVALQIPYGANSTDVSSQVLQLKQANPDVVIFISYTSDSILYLRTMRDLDYRPPVLIGDNSGFSDPSFAASVGNIAEGAINRSAWDPGKPDSVNDRLNKMFKAKTGRDLDDTTGRGMQGFFVLVDAINRAGSTDPEKIRQALVQTDTPPNQLFMGYKGVKFDGKGQNTLATTLLIQMKNGTYVAVWPEDRAVAPLELPYKGWGKP